MTDTPQHETASHVADTVLQVTVSDQGGWSWYVRSLYIQMLNASKGE